MRLLADSGSTKTDWCLVSHDVVFEFKTQGINPFHQPVSAIREVLTQELLTQLPSGNEIDGIFFYGAGCTREKSPILAELLKELFPQTVQPFVGSDMLGAARAVCQHAEGIACILGTGANSCLYNGEDIVAQVSPLGYILGDEGSAAYIGKRLAGDVLKSQFSAEICQLFFRETGLDDSAIIEKVYREPLPNRFLGQLSQFCQHHRHLDEIHDFLVDCFVQFFLRNVQNYGRKELPVNFVGSVACVYEEELRLAACQTGFKLGTIMQTPMEGLRKFHHDF